MSYFNSYLLFVSNKCASCDKILNHLNNEKMDIQTINIDIEEYNLPFSLIILPALVKGKKLIGYGCDDIIAYLNKNQL